MKTISLALTTLLLPFSLSAETFEKAISKHEKFSKEAYNILIKVESQNTTDPAYWISRANHAYRLSKTIIMSKGDGQEGFSLTDPKTGKQAGTIQEGFNPQKVNDALNSLKTARSLAPLRTDIHQGLCSLSIRLREYTTTVSASEEYMNQAIKQKGNLTHADGTKIGDTWEATVIDNIQSYAAQLNDIAKPDSDKALEEISLLMVEKFPKNPMGHNNLALVASIKKDDKALLQHLENAYKVAPQDIIVILNYAEHLSKAKQHDKANAILNKYLKIDDIPENDRKRATSMIESLKHDKM